MTATLSFAHPGLTRFGALNTYVWVKGAKGGTSSIEGGGTNNCTNGVTGGTIGPSNLAVHYGTAGYHPCSADNVYADCTLYVYDDLADFNSFGAELANTSAPNATSALPRIKVTLNGHVITITTDGGALESPTGTGTQCPGEWGWLFTGTTTAPSWEGSQAASFLACFGSDTGTNTTGTFAADLATMADETLGVNSGDLVIASADLDPTTSELSIG